jgi:hypothetical protein
MIQISNLLSDLLLEENRMKTNHTGFNPDYEEDAPTLEQEVIQEVPEDIQLCEFDCRKLQCAMGDWEKCERRLRTIEQTQKHTGCGQDESD